MDFKLSVLVLLALALLIDNATADLFYNRPPPKSDELESLNLKCMPGRTIIKVSERPMHLDAVGSDSDEFTRRKHDKRRQSYRDDDERCSICICSVDGKNEVCIKRPASSINECMVMEKITKKFERGEPYEHTKSLPFRIRRDLMWHNDEIPYDPASKCYRGHSYYTNHDTPNDTNINYDDDTTSLLDFKSQTSCYFCVCSVSGNAAGCISRSLWFCNYLRYLRGDNSGRDMYANMFQQDRPAYFRQLSWRLRRTMDNSMFDLVEQVGADKGETEQGQKDSKTCLPLVSEYSDCTAENECSGCTKCLCSAAGQWECHSVRQCDAFQADKIDDELFDAALDKLDFEMKTLRSREGNFLPTWFPRGKNFKFYKQILNLGKIYKSHKRKVTVEKKGHVHKPRVAFGKKYISYNPKFFFGKKYLPFELKGTVGKNDKLNMPMFYNANENQSSKSMGSVGNKDEIKTSVDTTEMSNNSDKPVVTIENEYTLVKPTGSVENDSDGNTTVGPIQEQDIITTTVGTIEDENIINPTVDTIQEQNIFNETVDSTEEQDITNATVGTIEEQDIINATVGTIEEQDIINATVGAIEEQDIINATVGTIEEQDTINATVDGIEEHDTINVTVDNIEDQDTINATVSNIEDQDIINVTVDNIQEQDTINASVGTMEEQDISNASTDTIQTKNNSIEIIDTASGNYNSNASLSTVQDQEKYNASVSSVEKKDMSFKSIHSGEHENRSKPLVGTAVDKEQENLKGTVEDKEKSNATISTIENTDNSDKPTFTGQNEGRTDESNDNIENNDYSVKQIDSAGKNDTSNASLRTFGKKYRSKRHIELKIQKVSNRVSDTRFVPGPTPKRDESDELLDIMNHHNAELKLKELSRRYKRSPIKKNTDNKHNAKRSADKTVKNRHPRNSNTNNTVKFYSTVDELNEDTLSHSNISGTLHAKKVELNTLPDISRRSNIIDNSNKSLHIDFNQPKEYNHITDNKIDTAEQESKVESFKNLNAILGNNTQKTKDKDLSKLVVNELKPGSEIIGDKGAPVMSNITFTAENDTLTAMAFIAGNLLNKLWNMEKDASGSSWETEDLKQEKISDLLDLFKEPLNLRQEAFLKNALEQISSAINKDRDIRNVTICQTIEEATKLIDHFNNTDDEDTPSVTVIEYKPCKKNNGSKVDKSKQIATSKAISKINNVLGLIKKFENVQRNLSLLKMEPAFQLRNRENSTNPSSKKKYIDTKLTKDEAASLNTFGSLIDRMTKLLLPKSNHKKLRETLKNQNALSNDLHFKNNFMKMYNIDLNNLTVTAKDKLVLDYIEHINSNPDCALNKKSHNADSKSLPTIEGNILLNLSEFFKMKSFADLINLLQPEKVTEKPNIRADTVKTTKPIKSTTATAITDKNQKFATTKQRLKSHLKSIIEDLIELQNASGIMPKGNIRIAEALPCIYNIMNAGKEIFNKNKKQNNGPDKIVEIFNGLKYDMKMAQTRRSDSVMRVRPKSAVVLERVIQNFAEKTKLNTRRSMKIDVTDPLAEIHKVMNKLRNVSAIYKNQAIYAEVPAADKLMLLKALAEDVKNYIIALEGIKVLYQNMTHMPPKQYNDLAAFVINSAANISLNVQIVKKVEKLDTRKNFADEIDTGNRILKSSFSKHTIFSGDRNNDNDMRISRNQIINHLIANRMKMYMKLKEAKELDVDNDLNYNVAKRVLFYLENGNYNLAHELFKMLVMQKHDKDGSFAGNEHTNEFSIPTPKTLDIPIRQDAASGIKPLVEFEEPKTSGYQMKWMNQDHLIKQLLNIKNMGL